MKMKMMLAVLVGFALVASTVELKAQGQRFLVYKTSASVLSNTDGGEFGKAKKIETYTIIDTRKPNDYPYNAYSLWFGKVGKDRWVKGMIYPSGDKDLADNTVDDLFRGGQLLNYKVNSQTGYISDNYSFADSYGIGETYTGKAKNGLVSSFKGSLVFDTGNDSVEGSTYKGAGVATNRTWKYDKKLTTAVAEATDMKDASEKLVTALGPKVKSSENP